jgi:hypothetical protein
LLPKIVEYGLAAEEEVRYIIEHDLRDELLAAKGLVPCDVAVNGLPAQTARSTLWGSITLSRSLSCNVMAGPVAVMLPVDTR